MKRLILSFSINLVMFFSSVVVVFSGLLIQIEYHMGNHGDIAINNHVLGISYSGWSDIHKFSIVIFSILMLFHIALHWKWYKAVITKKILSKNIQVITLSIVSMLAAVTGYTPWLIDLIRGDEMLRKGFIEIHDKLALVLLIYLILHIIKRLKWFFITFNKFTNRQSAQQQI
jgi:hypothetical protein